MTASTIIETLVEPVLMYLNGGHAPERPSSLEALTTIRGSSGLIHRVECMHDDGNKDLYVCVTLGVYYLDSPPTKKIQEVLYSMDECFPERLFFYSGQQGFGWRPSVSYTLMETDSLSFNDVNSLVSGLVCALDTTSMFFELLARGVFPKKEEIALAGMDPYNQKFKL